ncbi:hypothetical protein MYCTH_2302957 [Thermothelomyces thermophilus ATCC 42464]|uniref:Uncharacterized protein n=1 Tax=Thermothelomyces thermophilus (strain ATCC 42464 / BCRC 31852 / DSM 1799) TaxID=573729 RepID=G2Q8Z0_THET4|nr:uncharacterized protein MYCTH_2302957 [Thermothelomyces thermophilus ATCC 42464]AEO57134.1 hypothetical protein MYCTH_2302957 [Thermothelomyces thermophilus ATCC 42464]
MSTRKTAANTQQRAASTSQSASKAQDPAILAEEEREARFAEHWMQTLPHANDEVTYYVAFKPAGDASARDAVTPDEVGRAVGSQLKLSSADRVSGLFDKMEEGKPLGKVDVAPVNGDTLDMVKEKFEVTRITVILKQGGKRTAVMPTARTHTAPQGGA